MSASPITKAQAATIMATLLVATSFPVGAHIAPKLDSLILTLIRFMVASVLFVPIIHFKYGLKVPDTKSLARYASVSAALVCFFWGMFEALRFTSTLNTATIFTLTPIIAALVSFVLLGEKLTGQKKLALLVGLVGAVWVIFRGDLNQLLHMNFNRGDLIFLGATFAMGLYGPLVKKLHRGEPMAVMTFWTLVTGAVWLLVLSAGRLGTIDWPGIPVEVWLGIGYIAVFTTLITFFTFQWAMSIIGPTKVMSYTYTNPALVVLLGLMLGDAAPPALTWPGIVIAIGATVLLQRGKETYHR